MNLATAGRSGDDYAMDCAYAGVLSSDKTISRTRYDRTQPAMPRAAIGRSVALLFVGLVAVLGLVAGGYLATTRDGQTTSVTSSTESGVTTTTNCEGPDTYCGPYILLIDTNLTSSSTLGTNESLLAGTIECTHSNLSPPSAIELQWALPNPVNGGWPVGTNVTTIHIVTTGIDWDTTWTPNSHGEQETSYSFMIPNAELGVVRGMNYTVQAVANWNSGPRAIPTQRT